jgi:glycosyltransferase-like protein
MSLRVALYTYATQPRGGVAHAIELGNALHDAGVAVLLHALDEGGGFFRSPRCPYRTIAVPPERGDVVSLVRSRIAAYVAALEGSSGTFDIHHAHDGIGGNALATLVERGAIDAFVRTVHHADDFDDGTLAELQTRSIRAACGVFVVSDVWREKVRARFGIEASGVINGVDAARFVPIVARERTRIRHRFGIAGSPMYLAIGGIEARKNSLGILEAFARVRAQHPGAQLVIAGGASVFDHRDYRHTFAARAETLGLEIGSSVIVLGIVADREMPGLIASADALVFPSLTEGFGLVVLEALACDVPVVTSAIAPFTEYVGSDEAELVDPADPESIAAGMLAAIQPVHRARRALAGRAVVDRFSWPASARTHIARYEEILRARDSLRGSLAR